MCARARTAGQRCSDPRPDVNGQQKTAAEVQLQPPGRLRVQLPALEQSQATSVLQPAVEHSVAVELPAAVELPPVVELPPAMKAQVPEQVLGQVAQEEDSFQPLPNHQPLRHLVAGGLMNHLMAEGRKLVDRPQVFCP